MDSSYQADAAAAVKAPGVVPCRASAFSTSVSCQMVIRPSILRGFQQIRFLSWWFPSSYTRSRDSPESGGGYIEFLPDTSAWQRKCAYSYVQVARMLSRRAGRTSAVQSLIIRIESSGSTRNEPKSRPFRVVQNETRIMVSRINHRNDTRGCICRLLNSEHNHKTRGLRAGVSRNKPAGPGTRGGSGPAGECQCAERRGQSLYDHGLV